MATEAERALRKSMRDRSFERVYYFRGEDDFLKDGMARDLMDAVLDPSTRDFNLEVIRGDGTTAEGLDTALSTPPMFAERRMVVVRDAHALKKEARAVLDRYVLNPARDTVLLLITPAGEKDPADLPGVFVVDFPELEDHRLPAWIVHHASTALGTTITDEAARLLHETAGPALGSIASELDKLASYTAGAPIDAEAVRAVVGVRSGESLADLLDAVAQRDAARSVALVPVVLAQSKTNAVTAIMALATQTAALAWAREARDRGVPPAGIQSGFWTLLKEGKAFPGRPWKEAVPAWVKALPRWSAADLDRGLGALLAADTAAKDSRVSTDEQILTSLVLSLCTPAERVAA